MGASQSAKQEINNIVTSVVNKSFSVQNTAAASFQCSNVIKTGPGCEKMFVKNVTQTCDGKIDLQSFCSAVQKEVSDTDIQNNVKLELEQKLQNMSFNFTAQDTNQIINNITTICVNIKQSIVDQSIITFASSNGIICDSGSLKVLDTKQTSVGELALKKQNVNTRNWVIENYSAEKYAEALLKVFKGK